MPTVPHGSARGHRLLFSVFRVNPSPSSTFLLFPLQVEYRERTYEGAGKFPGGHQRRPARITSDGSPGLAASSTAPPRPLHLPKHFNEVCQIHVHQPSSGLPGERRPTVSRLIGASAPRCNVSPHPRSLPQPYWPAVRPRPRQRGVRLLPTITQWSMRLDLIVAGRPDAVCIIEGSRPGDAQRGPATRSWMRFGSAMALITKGSMRLAHEGRLPRGPSRRRCT